MVAKSNFDNTVSSLDSKNAENKTKNESIENEIKKKKKLKTLDLSYFIGKSYFEEDVTQNYLVFQPIYRYFKVIANTEFHRGNLKDYLTKLLGHLVHLIIVLISN